MKNKFLLSFLLISFQLLAQTDPSKKTIPEKTMPVLQNIPNIPANKSVVQTAILPQTIFYWVIPTLHRFLDTASLGSIKNLINDTPDSILRLVENESEAALANFISQNYTDVNNKDGDGQRSSAAGGADCNDLNPWVQPGVNENCSGFLLIGRTNYLSLGTVRYSGPPILIIHRFLDEDCNPCTISGSAILSDGDEDGDGQVSCSCTNYSLTERLVPGCPIIYAQSPYSYDHNGDISRYIIRGPDCDDHNPAIIRGAQQCLNDKSVKVCENGAWKIYNSHKCVVQPNGTGILLEW
jgi:hypothetical protein